MNNLYIFSGVYNLLGKLTTFIWVVVSNIFYVHPEPWEMIQFDEYFSKGLKPPTSHFLGYKP